MLKRQTIISLITLLVCANINVYAMQQDEDKDNNGPLKLLSQEDDKKLQDSEEKSNLMDSALGKYLEASFYGAARGLAGLPIEHPFDCLKTRSQASLKNLSSLEVLKEIYQQNGIKGFYAGAVPNAMRLAFKQTYRWPMMLAFPGFYDSILSEDLNKQFPSLKKGLTGVTIASFETFFICPLERLKVWLMTAYNNEKSLTTFFKENKSHLGNELFRGLNASFSRQIMTWSSFLVADFKFKSLAKEYTGEKELSFASLMVVSAAVGMTNTAAIMPFDCVKTKLQMRSPITDMGLINAFKYTYKNSGIKGLYAGWQPRMAQYMIQSAFTVPLLEKLENKWKKEN